MLWRLHIRPATKNGKTHDDVVKYCIDNHIAGIGWPVADIVSTSDEYERAARLKYDSNVASIPFARDIKIGDYVWARDKNGKYYLGCIEGDWYYSIDPLHLNWIFPINACRWLEIAVKKIYRKIVACFRPARTFRAIQNPLMETFLHMGFSREVDDKFKRSVTEPITATNFFQFIGADDCEDIVGLYLQKVKGYCLIPSSCKRTTIGYEFILKHSLTAQTAIVRKAGWVGLDDRLQGIADHVFLFSTEGVITSQCQDITVLTAKELYTFVYENKALMPSRINYWLRF